jgi:glycerate-2-kinase
VPTRRIRLVEAGHPMPDEAGLQGAEDTLKLAATAEAGDLLLVLLSGGGSANWIAPADGITFAQKQKLTRALLRSGAPIGEVNTVRKHLSRIKGGRLAPARKRDLDARSVRRAARRSVGDCVGADRARSDDIGGCARHRRQVQARDR